MCESSVDSAFKNFLRAGVLKKRSRIVMEVPTGRPASSTRKIFPLVISTMVPESWSEARVSRRRRDTDAIEGVFQELFHYRGRTFDNFSGSDLVGNVLGKDVNAAHGIRFSLADGSGEGKREQARKAVLAPDRTGKAHRLGPGVRRTICETANLGIK